MTSKKLFDVTLDPKSIRHWSPAIDHERRVAIFDLLEDNSFDLIKNDDPGCEGPFKLNLSISESRLVFDIFSESGDFLYSFHLSMSPFRRIIREYSSICGSYYQAIRTGSMPRIEALDMARRGVHNMGSEMLTERLDGKIIVNQPTARRLFTLIYVLHLKDGRGPL